VFAFSLPAVTLRSGADRPSLVIPDGVDVVSLDLQRDTTGARPPVARAVVRTIGGGEVWTGPASVTGNLPADVAARVEIPADRLTADDYIVSLTTTDPQGREYEERSYFLSVRAR
jgi:hypothetical protein